MSTQLKFGAYSLLGTFAPKTIDGSSLSSVVQLPRSDGGIALPYHRRPGKVTIEGGFHQNEAGAADIQSTLDALAAALNGYGPNLGSTGPAPQQNLQLDSNRYWRNAQKTSFSAAYDPTSYNDYVTLQIEFDLPDPYQYATAGTLSDTWGSPTSGGTHTINNTPVSSNGNAYALPQFVFTFSAAASTSITFTNTTTGQSCTLNGTPTNTQITIDCLAQTVKDQSGTDNMFLFDGQFIWLLPASNSFSITYSGQTPTSVQCVWVPRWV